MDDDLERRIRDLEGRAGPPVGGTGRYTRPTRKQWTFGLGFPVAIGGLYALSSSLPFFERVFPVLRQPAPSWVGLLVLILPFAAVVIYFVVQWRRRRRRDQWNTGTSRENDGESDCGGGGSGCSGSHSGCGGGDNGCGGGCGGGGH